jgi:hypothetical protein
MNLYLDTSALVKRYVNELGSEDVLDWMVLADMTGTGLITRADFLACQHGLRGYHAIHLAAALIWQEALMLPVTLQLTTRNLPMLEKNLV